MRPYQRRELRFDEALHPSTCDSQCPPQGISSTLRDLPLWQQVAGYRYAQFSLRRASDESVLFTFEFVPRWVPPLASRWDVLVDTLRPRAAEGECRVFYAFPLRTPGFMAVQYLLCGPQTPYATLRRSVEIVSWIAQARRCQAVVCQAISDRLSERVMNRWGYVPHAKTLGPGHYIHRLKDGL
jgi:hypothetical protein